MELIPESASKQERSHRRKDLGLTPKLPKVLTSTSATRTNTAPNTIFHVTAERMSQPHRGSAVAEIRNNHTTAREVSRRRLQQCATSARVNTETEITNTCTTSTHTTAYLSSMHN
jgi:hypothetical protein